MRVGVAAKMGPMMETRVRREPQGGRADHAGGTLGAINRCTGNAYFSKPLALRTGEKAVGCMFK